MSDLLIIALSATVPLWIMEIKTAGGVTADDISFAHNFARVPGEKGDILQYKSKKAGKSAKVFNGLARALAIMSFCPGGVKFRGEHWETT